MKKLPNFGGDFRVFPDGTVVAVRRRGVPPKAPEGYEPSSWDAWTFIPKLAPCPYRGRKKLPNNCCGRTPPLYCKFAEKNILRDDCTKCEAKPEVYFGEAQ